MFFIMQALMVGIFFTIEYMYGKTQFFKLMLHDYVQINPDGKKKVTIVYVWDVHLVIIRIQYDFIGSLKSRSYLFFIQFRVEQICFHYHQLISLRDDILLFVPMVFLSFFLHVVF